jgi:hypothetical protein
MEAVKNANNRREACEEPHLSFRDVSLSMVNRMSIPHGYRIATVKELEKSFNSSSSFNYELSEIGAAWAKGDNGETVCARIIDGKFTVANFREGSFFKLYRSSCIYQGRKSRNYETGGDGRSIQECIQEAGARGHARDAG